MQGGVSGCLIYSVLAVCQRLDLMVRMDKPETCAKRQRQPEIQNGAATARRQMV
ncbi:hypothetical protein [Kingella oralis]|uniref:hypothetical protein n=1 Tax=Kingella oralis TaxID=505 RepID=UPI003C703107